MITSIFSKSKPINFIIVVVFIIMLFVISNYDILVADFGTIAEMLFKLFVTLFSVFVLDFIISKNSLTQRNSYAIMMFGLMFWLFPEALKHSHLLLSNLFVLFALRRIISLHTKISIKKKLFDAAFWIALATLFYFWALLFFAIIIVALIYYFQNDVKNIIIPFIGVATVAVLLFTYNVIFYGVFITDSNITRFASLDFTPYNSAQSIMKLTLLFTSLVWILVLYFKNLADKNKRLRPSYFLTAWASVIAVLVAIIAPIKNGSEFIFLFAPFSIIMANYLEMISDRWFKEIFIVLFLIVPIVGLLL